MQEHNGDPMRRIMDGHAALVGLADLLDAVDQPLPADPSGIAALMRLALREIDQGVLAAAEPG